MQNCSSYGHRSLPERIYFLLLYLTLSLPKIYFLDLGSLYVYYLFTCSLLALHQVSLIFSNYSAQASAYLTFSSSLSLVDWAMSGGLGADGVASLVSSDPTRLSMLGPLLFTQSSTLFQADTLSLRRSSAWGAPSPNPVFDFSLTSLMPHVSSWKSCSQGSLL